jgi:hypothetical protein
MCHDHRIRNSGLSPYFTGKPPTMRVPELLSGMYRAPVQDTLGIRTAMLIND